MDFSPAAPVFWNFLVMGVPKLQPLQPHAPALIMSMHQISPNHDKTSKQK